jgi:predicted nucleotidyltransferase
MIVPNMGMKARTRSGLADALFSRVQQRVLGLVFGHPERRYQSAELIRLAGSGTGAVHRAVSALAQAGLITVTRVGNQKHYQANRESPVFSELNRLIVKTVGVIDPLREALAAVARDIEAAFVYGSVARGTETAASDIDLLVISDRLRYPEVIEALLPAERTLARPVNPNVVTRADWRAKREQPGSFANRIVRQPRLFVIGSDGDIA